ncbi:9965_t:CDS:2 [Entrophospora sp. SA101]|nr:9965_t:CDS:2 [Entrophospora sp. SA101]
MPTRDAGPEARLQGYHVSAKPFGVKSLMNCLPTELSDRLNEILPGPVTGEDHNPSFVDQFGELLISFPCKKFNNLREFSEINHDHTVLITFRDKIREFLLQGLDVQWNKKFVRYEIVDNGVWAYFDDGTKEFGDILVGSDGVNSPVRKQKLPDLEVKNLGVSCVIFDIAPSKDLVERFSKSSSRDSIFKISLGDRGDNLVTVFRLIPVETKDPQDDDIHYRFTFTYTYPSSFDDYDSDDYASFNKENNQPGKVISWVKRMINEKRENSEFVDVVKEMLDITPSKSGSVGKNHPFENYRPNKFPLRDLDPKSIERWSVDRVTLIGDAIHAMNPVLGLGMNHAMRDADKLSQSLLDWNEKGWEECIKNYEDEMINRCSPDVLNSRKICQRVHVACHNKFDVIFRNWTIKFIGLCLNIYMKIFS